MGIFTIWCGESQEDMELLDEWKGSALYFSSSEKALGWLVENWRDLEGLWTGVREYRHVADLPDEAVSIVRALKGENG